MFNELENELKKRAVDFIRIVDISGLIQNQNQGYNIALVIGVLLSPEYIHRLSVENTFNESEFSEKESYTDELAEWIADFIEAKGYKAYAQSERILIADGFYDRTWETTRLPHKTIALMSGLGWIGKSNLLISPDYGSAFSMCSVLTNAPLPSKNRSIMLSKCGQCAICVDVCQTKALVGSAWEMGIERNFMIDVKDCNLCLKCLAFCPWTQTYMKKNYPGYED
jgi:epoxyqueuosine reductase